MTLLVWLAGFWMGGVLVFLCLDVMARKEFGDQWTVEQSMVSALIWPMKLVLWLSRSK